MDTLSKLTHQLSPLQLGVISVCGTSLVYIVVKAVTKSDSKRRVYPPGPPQSPLIGNLRNFPKERWYETFCEWQKIYGDLIWMRMPGMSMLVVNNLDIAHELLSKNPSLNSGRSTGYMMTEIMDFKWNLGLREPDKNHQEIRKMLRNGIGPQRVGSHDPLLEDSTKELILQFKSLRGDPTLFLVSTMGHVVIQIGYGEQVWNTVGKQLVDLNMKAVGLFSDCVNVFWMVNMFPILRFVPSWFPGAEFQRLGKTSRAYVHQVKTLGWNRLLELHRAGTSDHSLGADLLEDFGSSENVRDAIGILYFAGVDTTTSLIAHFLHAIFMFPDVAKKIHDEIVRVVGEDRLPTIADRPNLPYTEAVYKESLRWRTGLPFVLPHTSLEDQYYNGYFIPKGTMINPNYGFMLTNPAVWGDPERFRPERFMIQHNPNANNLPNPTQLVFGFGTRVCVGINLADRIAFHIGAVTMSLYQILPLEGKAAPTPDTATYYGDLIRFPKDFNCRFVPWGQSAANLLSSLSLEK